MTNDDVYVLNCRIANGGGDRFQIRHPPQQQQQDQTGTMVQRNEEQGNASTTKRLSAGTKVQRILEKGKVNLSRSKSELGEQHKKIVSHLSRGRSELSEQNKKIMATLTSGVEKGRRQLSKVRQQNKRDQDQPENGHQPLSNEEDRANLEQKQNQRQVAARDVDTVLYDLGININGEEEDDNYNDDDDEANDFDRRDGTIVNNNRNNNGHQQQNPRNCDNSQYHNQDLERRLEEGYGEEFEFIDGHDMTLTREDTAAPIVRNGANGDENGFADEVFDELSKSSTFKRSSAADVTVVVGSPASSAAVPRLFPGSSRRRDSLGHYETSMTSGGSKLDSWYQSSSSSRFQHQHHHHHRHRRQRRLSSSSVSGVFFDRRQNEDDEQADDCSPHSTVLRPLSSGGGGGSSLMLASRSTLEASADNRYCHEE